MDRSGVPAPHLVKGLRRLVEDIRLREAREANGLAEVVCGKTELLCFSDCGVSYCGEPVEELAEHPAFERTIWLLLTRSLPTEEQLADCSSVVSRAVVMMRCGAPSGPRSVTSACNSKGRQLPSRHSMRQSVRQPV